MFYQLLLRLLLLAKKKDRILSIVDDSSDPGIAYILKIEKYDSNWSKKLYQMGVEAGIITKEEFEEQFKNEVS